MALVLCCGASGGCIRTGDCSGFIEEVLCLPGYLIRSLVLNQSELVLNQSELILNQSEEPTLILLYPYLDDVADIAT